MIWVKNALLCLVCLSFNTLHHVVKINVIEQYDACTEMIHVGCEIFEAQLILEFSAVQLDEQMYKCTNKLTF